MREALLSGFADSKNCAILSAVFVYSFNMSIKYRHARAEDYPFILDILKSVSGSIADMHSEKFLIADDGNKILGCIRTQNIGGCTKLASLVVLPNYRNMGIGSSLVIRILNETVEKPVYLFCNIKNEVFYKKFGFKRIKIKDIPKGLKEDYDDLLNLKFAKNVEVLIAMILV